MTALPAWTPEFVRPLLSRLDRNPACKGSRRAAFEKLVSDKRTMQVYDQFIRRDRKTGNYLYPAVQRKRNQSPERAQLAALREVLCVAVSAAGDRMSVSNQKQLLDAKKRWKGLAVELRMLAHDLGLAIELGQLGLDDRKSRQQASRDIVGLVNVAGWLDGLTSALRRPGDPLLVKRQRGDPVVRGVQILISVVLEKQFGTRLDGTAATLASAALGVRTTARASRSALTKRKPSKTRPPK